MNDIREALEKAYAEADEPITTDTSPEPVAEPEPERAAEEATPQESEAPPEAALDPKQTDAAPQEPVEEPPALDPLTAPSSWRADEREFWNNLPREAQETVLRREKEMEAGLEQTREEREYGRKMREFMSPYEQTFQQQGVAPEAAMGQIMQVLQRLYTGSAQDKAQVIANAMQQYGVDAGALADVIAGGNAQSPQDEIARQVEAQVQQRMQPFMQQQEQARQAQIQQVQQEMAAFAAEHEFFNDVREQMADYVDLRTQQGHTATLQEAYDFAIQMNPHVQSVMQKRTNAERQQRAAAASSMKPGGTTAPPSQGHPDTLRGAILDAWDAAENG